jgi:signal transduction histidine kinase
VACLGLVVAPLRILRTRPVLVSLALAAVILTATRLSDFWPAGSIVALAISYFYGAHASLPGGAVAIAVLIVAMQVGMGFSEFPNVEIGFVTLIPFWLGYQVRLRSSLVSRLTERTRELREEHDAFARLSVRRERARIARELHDIVAHHLAVMVVQAGAGRIAGPGASQRASERFATIRQSGGQALAEMGRLVDLLHAEDPHGHDSTARWQLLVDDARAGGLTVQITSLPSKVQLPGALTDHAYQIVREGLTNAIKHAPGAHVTVHLAQRDAQLQIEVHDDGSRTGVSLAETGAGLGLMGMRERIESTGGTIVAGPDCDGGWCLRAALPLDSPGVVSKR